MMMVAAGREEQRTGIGPYRLVEAEPAVVERLGFLQVADVQVYVSHRRAGRRSVPGDAVRRADHASDVEAVGGHGELPLVTSPGVLRPVGIDFDPQAVR